ncbi:MAG: nicotinamide-nucleotide adenylyltransferase [Candidatus Methanoplasma sp.]|jgi:nicotinamide-nucleotide adenylyltransferase|nr:nicotinamide-nucleotide adenylyltransferase [Candidatus Methanoplasma sp.]
MVSKNCFGERSLIIGRFQPFHNGHMDVMRKCASESENLIIGIGSAQYSHECNNPFTAGERYLMIDEAMKGGGITNYCIIPIEDLKRYSLWVAQVRSLSPPFSGVYSNNPLTRRLFSEAGYEVRDSPLYNREIHSGTAVRREMIEGDKWRSLVPREVAEVIDCIDGVQRLREISGGE